MSAVIAIAIVVVFVLALFLIIKYLRKTDSKPKMTDDIRSGTDDIRSGVEYHYTGVYKEGDSVITTRNLNVRKDALFEGNYVHSVIRHGSRGTIIRMVTAGLGGAGFMGYEVKFNDGFTGTFIPEYYLEQA